MQYNSRNCCLDIAGMARSYEILSLNLMAVMLCVEMQPETICVSHRWSGYRIHSYAERGNNIELSTISPLPGPLPEGEGVRCLFFFLASSLLGKLNAFTQTFTLRLVPLLYVFFIISTNRSSQRQSWQD